MVTEALKWYIGFSTREQELRVKANLDLKETAMLTDILVIGELFLLRIGLPLLIVAAGGYLLSRYVEARRASTKVDQRETSQEAAARKAEERRKNRVA